jgi:hypothetical protein
MRQALLSYHVLFTELLTDPDAQSPMSTGTTDRSITSHEIKGLEATT